MVHHVLPQQVILLGTGLGKLPRTERQVAVGKQADRDPEGVRRHEPLPAILADHLELPVAVRRHIEPAVAQRMEQPVPAAIVLRQPAGHREHERLQLQREIDPEEIGRDIGTLILGNQLPVDDVRIADDVCIAHVALLQIGRAAQGESRCAALDVKRAELCNWLPAGQLRHPEVQGVGHGGFGDVPAKDLLNEVDDGFVHGGLVHVGFSWK